MDNQEFCSNCRQKNDCKTTYEKLGKVKSSSVAIRAIIAFLVPIAVFIAAMAAFGKLFEKTIDSKDARVALSALLALCITLACIVVLKFADKRFSIRKDRQKETENRN